MHQILFYFIIITLYTFQFSNAQISNTIEEINNHPNLKAGRWSVYALNIKTGKIIADYNSDKIMYPASNLKLLTTAVALDKLGSEFVMNTYIEYDGVINSKGILEGNLFVRGEGDPTLGSNEMEGVIPYDSPVQLWVDNLFPLV